uniref:BTB domain-containing protein n=1 Tax=Timema douglasi TaxID=61478 RepID=A0A7R8Z758_TIMDO|nr:unnamed protein product [Timema douglasi]
MAGKEREECLSNKSRTTLAIVELLATSSTLEAIKCGELGAVESSLPTTIFAIYLPQRTCVSIKQPAVKMSSVYFKWDTHADLLRSLERLLQTECMVDVTIAIEGQLLKAHKLVLCACSQYFHTMLSSIPATHPIIFMRDVKLVEMKALLSFMYRGEACVSQEEVEGVLRTADALGISGLTHISWADTADYIQVDETSQCDESDFVTFVIGGEVGEKEKKDEPMREQALDMISAGQMGIKPAARAFSIPVATLHHAARRRNITSPMQQGGYHSSAHKSQERGATRLALGTDSVTPGTMQHSHDQIGHTLPEGMLDTGL